MHVRGGVAVKVKTQQNVSAGLRFLARMYGVQSSYYDNTGGLRRASAEALRAILRAMGVEAAQADSEIVAAVAKRRREIWKRGLEPVSVVWLDRPSRVVLRIPEGLASADFAIALELESGELRQWNVRGSDLIRPTRRAVERGIFVRAELELGGEIPVGYHRLRVATGETRFESRIIAAPPCAWQPEGFERRRTWGAFVPLYALKTQDGFGVGDFTQLRRLIQWVGGLGGGITATLPMLAAFLDEPCEPSPYAPVSRLFWNEFFVDPMPRVNGCGNKEIVALAAEAMKDAREANDVNPRYVDYRSIMAAKRRVLDALADDFFSRGGENTAPWMEFTKLRSEAKRYATFRARQERLGKSWREWSESEKNLDTPIEAESKIARRHLFFQFMAHEQLAALADEAREHGPGLYLDLPLGVHSDGYDAMTRADLFACGVTAGAPPDMFFTKGQNWGFAPGQPHRAREQAHDWFIETLRNHLRYAGMLRLDHVMGLHRLYWIPEGMPATEGTYVRNSLDELMAVVCVESHRHRAIIIGEDLGTVPWQIRRAMERHGIMGMCVTQFEMNADTSHAVPEPGEGKIASLNTHDLPPFAAFWEGTDIADRAALGLISEDESHRELESRGAKRHAVTEFLCARGELDLPSDSHDASESGMALRGCLKLIASSPARIVLVNLEDLWLETRPQNTPGTSTERINWRRKARLDFEEIIALRDVRRILEHVQQARRDAEGAR